MRDEHLAEQRAAGARVIPVSLDSDSDSEEDVEEVVKVPEGAVLTDYPNEVVETQRSAAVAGVDLMRLPAPLDIPERDSLTSWSQLYSDFCERFEPGIVDAEVLTRTKQFPTREVRESYARPALRQKWERVPLDGQDEGIAYDYDNKDLGIQRGHWLGAENEASWRRTKSSRSTWRSSPIWRRI